MAPSSIPFLDPGRPTLVIAEIGVNHDGSVERALKLVEHAAAAGADAVKLQIFQADTLVHASSSLAGYQAQRCRESHPTELLRRLELGREQARIIVDAIRSRCLMPLATPFSPEDLETIAGLDLPAIKIASPDLVNLPLLERASALGRPLLISTGAATLEEVSATVRWLRDRHVAFALLHCISSYPAPAGEANLCWIGELSSRFDVPVGYSDHTTEELAGAMAVAAGARMVEKHLTYDRSAQGPDHAASADPEQFRRYVVAIRLAESLRGQPGKRVLPLEEDVRRVSRQSIVVRRAVAAGQTLCRADLTVQRPGNGIPAAQLDHLVGRKTARALPAGTMLQWDLIAPQSDAESAADQNLGS